MVPSGSNVIMSILKSKLNLLEDLVFLTSLKNCEYTFSFYFEEKMTVWSASFNKSLNLSPLFFSTAEIFQSMLELLKIPSDSDFHKNFKYINKSSGGIKLREISRIS